MILSDRTIREELAAGRIVIDPLDESCIQPSSVDLRLDRLFRVFLNHTMPVIDVRRNLEELTHLVEIADGDAFILHPGEFVLGSTAEAVGLPDDLVARIEGKALALDTEIATPHGWTTMGELEVGDHVFGADGVPVPVVAATPPMYGRPCRDVELCDGTVVVADVAHQWLTRTEHDAGLGRAGSIRTTAEIEAAMRAGGPGATHRVPTGAAVRHPPADLPVDPYPLHRSIGAGAASVGSPPASGGRGVVPDEIGDLDGSGVARSAPPLAVRPAFAGTPSSAQVLGPRRTHGPGGSCRGTASPGREHIPTPYPPAGAAQRRALLRSLMDATGTDSARRGRCRLTTVGPVVAGQVHELVAGLGHRPVVTVTAASLRRPGADPGSTFAVAFAARPPAPRRGVTGWSGWGRSIVAVRERASVPVRCIEVGRPDGLFLASRALVPTHNSSLGRLGLLIHSTAGFVDAGFSGHITLELSNVANLPITLYPGMKIGQVSFLRMTTPADVPYGSSQVGSKYQGQRGPTPSRYWENFTGGG